MTQVELLQYNIDAVKELILSHKEKRAANVNILREYKGFGAIKDIRRNPWDELNFSAITNKTLKSKILEFHDLIKDAMGGSEKDYLQTIRAIQNSTLTAYYTPEDLMSVLKTVYINEYDKIGVNVLDPSAGLGIFTEGMKNANVISIEKDRLTSGILRAMHKGNNNHTVIRDSYQDIINADEYQNLKFDLVCTNAPFGNTKLNDKFYNKDKGVREKSLSKIHDYFMIKSIDSLKPGGTMIMITSTGIADNDNEIARELREEIVLECKLKNIIRLPNNTFSEAGTKVNSDLYILEKREQKLIPDIHFVDTDSVKQNLTQLERDFRQTNKITLIDNNEEVSKSINKAFYDEDFRLKHDNLFGTPKIDFFNNKKTIVFENNGSKQQLILELYTQLSEAKNLVIKPSIANTPPTPTAKETVIAKVYGQLDLFGSANEEIITTPPVSKQEEKLKFKETEQNKTLSQDTQDFYKLLPGDTFYSKTEKNFIVLENDNSTTNVELSNFSIDEINKAIDFHLLINSFTELTNFANNDLQKDIISSTQFIDFIENYNNYTINYGPLKYSIDNSLLTNRTVKEAFLFTIEEKLNDTYSLKEDILQGKIPDLEWEISPKNKEQEIEIYITKEDRMGVSYDHIIDNPTKNELGAVKADLAWGMKKGVISLTTPERTTTTYWRVKELQLDNTLPDELVINLNDAIKKSLNEKGEINISYISSQTGLSTEEIIKQAIDDNLLYPNPNINTVPNTESYEALNINETSFDLVTKDEFLSGPVRFKIEELKSNGANWEVLDSKQIDNYISQLTEIENPFITVNDLDPQLGESWIPNKYFEEFASELFKTNITILKSSSSLQFTVDYDYSSYEMNNKWAVACKNGRSLRGTKLLEIALSGGYPKITYSIKNGDGSRTTYPDRLAMLEAANKINDIQSEWITYISKNENISNELENIYNNTQNLYQERIYDGNHLTFPNLEHFVPREHQKHGVWQMMVQNGGLVDHAVGAGKTLSMALQAMELKRLGLSNKTMIIAMKANASAIAQEFTIAYPNSKVLSPTDKDLKKENRVEFFEKMKQDWDAIVLTHDQFKFIPQSRELQQDLIEEELENIRKDLSTLNQTEGKASTGKQLTGLERRLENKQAELKKVLDSIDKDPNLLTFDKMGIDHLMVDESQIFKNLSFTTRHDRVSGLGNPEGSQRAFNLLVACRTIQNKFNDDKGITFLSGTPISNSLVELYLLFKYLRPRELERRGMTNFDEWARTYAKLDRDFELTVTNEIKSKDRFRFFLKVPELATFYRTMSNIVTNKELKVDKPELNLILEEVEPSNIQRSSMEELVKGVMSADFSALGYNKSGDNIEKAKMLIATNLATKISLDMRLLDVDRFTQSDGSKINKLCENVINEYIKSNNDLGTQFIFLDQSTPTSKDAKEFNMYDAIKDTLVNQYGLKDEEIQFVHNHDTKPKRTKLFKQVNAGDVRIIIGSTQKMGTGVNMQQKCIAMHHVDIPWNPKDFTQRNGRGERQGNEVAKKYGNEVNCYVYATEQSLDAYKYYLMDLKARFIEQIKTNAKIDFRTLDEGDMDQDGKMSAAAFIAKLSGQEELLEKTKIDKKLSNLKALKETLVRSYNKSNTNIKNIEILLPKVKQKGENYKIDHESFVKAVKVNLDLPKDKIHYTLKTPDGKEYKTPTEIKDFYDKIIKEKKDIDIIGSVGDFTLKVEKKQIESFMNRDDSEIFAYPLVIESNLTGEKYTRDSSSSYYDVSSQVLYTSMFYNLNGLDRKHNKQEEYYDEQSQLVEREKEHITTVDVKKYDSEINQLEVKSLELHTKILEGQMTQEEKELENEQQKDEISQENNNVKSSSISISR